MAYRRVSELRGPDLARAGELGYGWSKSIA
jgi:hypothetical protein